MAVPGGWDSVRSSVRDEVGRSAYEAWFQHLDARAQGDQLVLLCPDRFSREWIQRRYGAAVQRAAGAFNSVHYAIAGDEGSDGREAHAELNRRRQPNSRDSGGRDQASGRADGKPQQSYETEGFETFVIGPGNALALEAARALAGGSPGRCTPLLIAGGSGAGKTHLCRAIAKASRTPVVYRSSEEFTSEVTSAMHSRGMDAVRQRYRRQDSVLILEDIQFLVGKRATQMELFHTLEHRIGHQRAVVLTSDRPPQALDLEPRLVSRMTSGLIARIGPSDSDMRREILRKRAAHGGLRIPEDCLDILAARPIRSTADLIGGLNQVVARATLQRRPITRELVYETLADVDLGGKPVTLEEIMRTIAQIYSLRTDDLSGKSRRQRFVRPRHLAMYLCRRYTECSFKEIGRAFQRDHTSVMHAIRAVEDRIAKEPRERYQLESLATRFGAPASDRPA